MESSFDAPMTPVLPSIQIPTNTPIKSASVLNILPFIFLYILKNHQKEEKVKCDSDKLYEYIPDKSKKIHPNLKKFLLAIPVLALLFKSNNNVALEHTFVILSYAIGIKTAMHFMTPCLAKQEFTNIVAITLLLNLVYFDILPKQHMHGGYLASVMYSLFLIAGRETTSANLIMDYTIAHFVFVLPKYLNASA